ncbi:MAG: helix-turn-helix transcriptional regulator [Gammaproteobacteria bacterium]
MNMQTLITPLREDDRFLTKEDVAERLCVSTQTVWRLEKAGDFPSRRQVTAGRVGYLLSELVEWMHARPAVNAPDELDGGEA